MSGKSTGHLDFSTVTAVWRMGELTAAQAMRKLGMSKATFYRKVKSISK